MPAARPTWPSWSACSWRLGMVRYRINGGGHGAPRTIAGRSFAEVLWDFFAAHPMAG